MSTRVIVIRCAHQFNAIYKGGELKAMKNIRPGDIISLKRLPKVKLTREISKPIMESNAPKIKYEQ